MSEDVYKGIEENVEIFKDDWEKATAVSPHLKWAIFPVGAEEVEFQAAKRLMELFDNLEGFIYFKEGQDPKMVVRALEDMLAEYKARTKSDKIALAAEQHEYELHLGS
jgi:hypothetical protein